VARHRFVRRRLEVQPQQRLGVGGTQVEPPVAAVDGEPVEAVLGGIAVVGGEVQIHYPAPAVGIPHIKAGRLTGLGFTGKTRLAALPEVPTIAEAGVPGYYADAGWHGVFAPARTPAAIVKKLQEAFRKALQVPFVHDTYVNNGYDPQGHTPQEWTKIFLADLKRYAEIVRIAKIEAQ